MELKKNENLVALTDYKQAIADFLGVSVTQISLFWKGRVGLYAILQALDIGEGDEVLLPGFTCVVVANAIIYRKARPVYIDIDPSTFTIDPQKIAGKITPQTKAILVQNTFGLSPDFAPIRQLADQYQLKIIEDNTHGFGSTYRGQQSGLLGDAAFFSSQWNKPFSTGIGGFVVAHGTPLIQRMQEIEANLDTPSFTANWMLRRQIQMRQLLGNSQWYWPALRAYRWLSKHNIIGGSSAGTELEGTRMPDGFLQKAGTAQAEEGLRQLAIFDKNLQHRKALAEYYQSAMQSLGFAPLQEPEYARHIFLKYVFFVRDRDRFLDLAAKHHIPLGDWFLSPLHPISEGWERWGYEIGICPIAEKISAHILNLPTDPGISLQEAQRIMAFIQQHQTELMQLEF